MNKNIIVLPNALFLPLFLFCLLTCAAPRVDARERLSIIYSADVKGYVEPCG